MRSRFVAVAALLSITVLAARATMTPDTVPNPVVTGPIPANVPAGDPTHDYPFFATAGDTRDTAAQLRERSVTRSRIRPWAGRRG